jgi:hypothetical protein
MYQNKRGRLGELGGSMYDQTISSGTITRTRDSVHYDTNILVTTSADAGVTSSGVHGRFARFRDTRLTPILGNTDDYTVSLVRGVVTTNDIPLFCPKPSKLITLEDGTKQWEVSVEPGLALTWTGSVVDNNLSVTDNTTFSWPNEGFIPYYTGCTTGAPTYARKSGFLKCGLYATGPDTLASTAVTRLNAMFPSPTYGGSTGLLITVTENSGSGATVATQKLSFTNGDANNTVYLDFTMPSAYAQQNGQTSLPYVNANHPSKKGILQACKLLGFIPNTIFAIPPSSTVVAPRAYQLGFRATIDAYCYKAARWVPEDLEAISGQIPTEQDVKIGSNGTNPTYFDCYSYQHFLTKCINPTFQRLIYDPTDSSGSIPLSEQCLTRQIQGACAANVAAAFPWSSSVSYVVGNSVNFEGRAYAAIRSSVGQPVDNTIYWFDCGPAYLSTWIPGFAYSNGDLVSYQSNLYTCIAALGSPTTAVPTDATKWSSVSSISGLVANKPAIGTAAPYITFNPSTQLFSLNLDSYGFGGTSITNVDDGSNGGFSDDLLNGQSEYQQRLNSALNDQARDSWGLTGSGLLLNRPYTVARHPLACYDERMLVEVDDYFHQLFGNWPAQRLSYTDPLTTVTTSYIRYIPDVTSAGLGVSQPLPPLNPTVVTSGYLPYGRVAGNTPYFYTYLQDYPSIGLLWNPVDTLVVVSGEVPLLDDQISPPFILGDTPTADVPNGNTLKILGEYVVRPVYQSGQQFRSEIIFEPATPLRVSLQSSRVFITFGYQILMRMKNSGYLRPLSISNGGSVFMRFEFQIKQ